eukprot:10697017-Alexandrium_andersonii.AAC.1
MSASLVGSEMCIRDRLMGHLAAATRRGLPSAAGAPRLLGSRASSRCSRARPAHGLVPRRRLDRTRA